MLVEEIKEDLNKWRNVQYLRVKSLYTVKMSILPRSVYRYLKSPARGLLYMHGILLKLTEKQKS